MCVYAYICVCARETGLGIQDAIWQWHITPSATRPCVSDQNRWITDPDHCTHQTSPKINTHYIHHQYTDASREHANCSLWLSINLSFFFSFPCLSHHYLFPSWRLFSLNLPHGAPPHPPNNWDQSKDTQRYSLRLQKTLNRQQRSPEMKTTTDVALLAMIVALKQRGVVKMIRLWIMISVCAWGAAEIYFKMLPNIHWGCRCWCFCKMWTHSTQVFTKKNKIDKYQKTSLVLHATAFLPFIKYF